MTKGSGALMSECGKYRYKLWRWWAPGPGVTWVMLNPSTADADVDDPTIRRCIGFAKLWGAGRIDVVNLFALRATDPEQLKTVTDRIGPQNDHVLSTKFDNEIVVAAWGTKGSWWGRSGEVLPMLQRNHTVFYLGLTANGEPAHPLYLPADAPLHCLGVL